MRLSARAGLCLLTIIVFALPAFAGSPLWSYKPGAEIKWQRLTATGQLLVGTDSEVACIDPDNGQVMWKRSDLGPVTDDRIDEVDGTPMVLINARTQLHAINIEDGKAYWQTDKVKGQTVAVLPIPDRNFVLLLTSDNPRYAKIKPDMIAMKLDSGEVLWTGEFVDNVDLHVANDSGRFMPRFDLSGHQPPIYDGTSLYFTYAGLHRYDIETGKLMWGAKYDVTEGNLKRGNAQAIIDGDMVYTSAKGVIRGIDRNTGAIKWSSSDFGAAVAQMDMDGNLIFGRMGGTFYENMSKTWMLKKPLGVVAVSKNTGQTVWKYDGAKDSITNMVLLPQNSMLLIADQEHLIALDTKAEGKVKESMRMKLEFKHKLGGGAKAARTAMKFARGGLMGGLKKSKEDIDPPISVSMRGNGLAVVQGKQHLLAFNPQSKSIQWSVQYQAPGAAGWQKAVWGAVTAVGYATNMSVAMGTQRGTGMNDAANQNKNMFAASYEKLLNKRSMATREGQNFTYILSNVEDGKDNVPGIIGVNLDSGTATTEIAIGEKDPNYVVDEGTGRLFNLKDKREIQAFAMR